MGPTSEPVAGLAAREQEPAAEVPHITLDELLRGQREGLVGHIREDHEIVAFELTKRSGEGGGRAYVDIELLRVERARQIARALRLALDVQDRGTTRHVHGDAEGVVVVER